jgi:heat shock protein HslJ/sporulation protein YlmC with PRC-barrel domain
MLNQQRWKLLLTTLLLAVVLAAAGDNQVLVASASEDDATPVVESDAVQSEPDRPDGDVTVGRSVRAGDVLGFEVRNMAGDKIGEVEDIVINMVDAQVLFVTMNYSGGLFKSDKIYPVPVSAFRWDPIKEELQLDLDEETLQDAPGFDKGWPDPANPNYDQEVYKYWLGIFPELPPLADKLAGAVTKVSLMIGLEVFNLKNESLGEIEDIIVNVELQLLSSIVLNFDTYTGTGKAQYVLPLAGFELDVSIVDEDNSPGTLLLDMSPNNLRYGPSFSDDVDLSNPNWSEPYQSWWQRMQSYTEQVVTPLTLTGTAWEAESFGEPEDNLPVLPGTHLTLNFLGEKYGGSGGCDWFRGVYDAQADHTLRLNMPSQTRVGCTDVNLMTQQGTYLSSLLNILEYELKDDKLIGYTVLNQRLLTFVPADPIPFETTTWALKFLSNDTSSYSTIIGVEITAQFEGDQVSGSAGCNTYTATVARKDNKLSISSLTVTEKSCTEPEGIMSQEEEYLSLLQTTDSMIQIGGALQLADVRNQARLLFGVKNPE